MARMLWRFRPCALMDFILNSSKTILHFSIRSWQPLQRPFSQKWRLCTTFTTLKERKEEHSSGLWMPIYSLRISFFMKKFHLMALTAVFLSSFPFSFSFVMSCRCYPGPWKVLRRVGNRYMTLHQQEAMPSLKEVALNILPSSWTLGTLYVTDITDAWTLDPESEHANCVLSRVCKCKTDLVCSLCSILGTIQLYSLCKGWWAWIHMNRIEFYSLHR